jgi:glutamyl-tRNA synthetase
MPLVRAMSDLVPPFQHEPVRGRYAPSPSGDLHTGNLRTALLAWLFARAAGGQFVLRVEDLDRPRVKPGATQRMLDDLHWLGLDWDEGPDCGGPYAPYTQSLRIELYEQALARLQAANLVYPCYCSRTEVLQAASAPQLGAEGGPRYPGTCRHLTRAQIQRYETLGRKPSLRFRVPDDRVVHFVDLLTGPASQQVQQTVGDFVVRRSDGIFAYQFAVVVDDGLMHINQVVRGADLHDSTARQILLFEALQFPLPRFAHVPLVLDEQGKRLAKRQQSSGLAPLRAAGQTPAQVLARLAASCGLCAAESALKPEELLARYTLDEYGIMRAILHNQ